MKYVVVIPAKNEEDKIGSTLTSLIRQTLQPKLVVVVDNESDDKTSQIVKDFSARFKYIQYLSFSGEKAYALGGKIVQIFTVGKKHIDQQGISYDYIVKMDADINLSKDVFSKIASHVAKGDKFGIVSPLAYIKQNGHKVYTSTPDWHTAGDFKVYNRKCYEAIGGARQDLGWDCADNLSAMEQGYVTRVFRDVYYEQTRPIGRYSLLKGWKRQGVGAFKLRYNFFYLLLKSVHDVFKSPFFLGSMYFLWGYFSAFISQRKRVVTKPQGKILRKLLWQSLFHRLKSGGFYLFQVLNFKKKHP